MPKIKDTALKPVRFVQRHRVAIAIFATAYVCGTVMNRALDQHDAFLREHDLYDEFYEDNKKR